jgi:hypothetical protein
MTIHFDDALPSLASVIRAELGKAELEGGGDPARHDRAPRVFRAQ